MINLTKDEIDIDKGIDYQDSRQVISAVMQMSSKKDKIPLQFAKQMFDIAATLNQGKTELTIREIAELIGIFPAHLSYAKTVAKRHNNNWDSFLREYEDLKCTSWKDYIKKKNPPVNRDWYKLIHEMVKKINEMIEKIRKEPQDANTYKGLEHIRNNIIKYVPLDYSLLDENYIKYYECCCCGSYPPPEEGHIVRQYKGSFYIKYPLCNACAEINRSPNLEKMMVMYAAYAVNLERAYDMIHVNSNIATFI